jgi:hypothetical protein
VFGGCGEIAADRPGPLVTALVSAIVRGAHRRRALVLSVIATALAASIAGVGRLSFDSDILSLLPQDGRVITAFRMFVGKFGGLDQLAVVFTAPEGHTISEYEDEVDAWVGALRQAPEIEQVDAGVIDRTRDVGWLGDRQLLLLTPGQLETALSRFTPAGMATAVAARRDLLAVPSPEVTALVQQDPLGLFDLAREAGARTQAGLNIGADQAGYVTSDRRARLVMARPTRPPFDAAFSRALDRRLKDITASLTGQSPLDEGGDTRPPLLVEFAGGHRIAVETETVVKQESIFNTVGALTLILPLLFLVFRSVWLVGVGSLPSALALVLVLGALGFAGARLSAASTGAAAMLFGLGIDGVVLLYVAHRQALARGLIGHPTAPIEGPSVSMLIGMLTTAATFYGLAFVDFPSLRQLGLLIGHSMVACAVLTLVMVPALLPRGIPRRAPACLVMPRLASWIVRRRLAVLVGAAIVTAGLGVAAFGVRVDPTLDRLRSTTEAARLEQSIGPAFGLPANVYVVVAGGRDLDALLRDNERLAARLAADLPDLAFEPATRLLPSSTAQEKTMARVGAANLSVGEIRASLARERDAAGFTPGAFDPFLARLPALIDPAQRLDYDDYVAHGLGDLVGRFAVRDGDTWWLATYVFPENAAEAARVQAVVDAVDPAQTLTGLPLVNADLAGRFLPDFFKGLGIGTALVVLLVVAAFRDARLSVLALLPTVIGLIWTAGVLAIAGVVLDLFAIFAIVTFVGIGVDYGVHLVHRYHEHRDATRAAAELAPVILVAAAITLFGYATLITSSYPPLQSIGVVSTISVVALAGASLLVLPALLWRSGDS